MKNEKASRNWGGAIDSEEDHFVVKMVQTTTVESWNKIISEIPWKTSDKNEKMQLSVLTGYYEILNHDKKRLRKLLQNIADQFIICSMNTEYRRDTGF